MTEPKTKPTQNSVKAYLDSITDTSRRADCEKLIGIMSNATGETPVMWGTAIVGFGAYEYPLSNGKCGSSCRTGFSSRKGDISIYLVASGADQEKLLAKLGRHKMGKACLYVRRLSDVDLAVIEALIIDSLAELRRRYG